MPRRLRIEFEGAIYHFMAAGHALTDHRRTTDYDMLRLIDDSSTRSSVAAGSCSVLVVWANHLHLLLKSPLANLARGCRGDSPAMPSVRRVFAAAPAPVPWAVTTPSDSRPSPNTWAVRPLYPPHTRSLVTPGGRSTEPYAWSATRYQDPRSAGSFVAAH